MTLADRPTAAVVDRRALTAAAAAPRRRALDPRPYVALAVVLAGFVLRTRQLGVQSFWWDEAYSAVVARGSLREIVAAITAADFHPPLHYVLFHYWRMAAGESEYALRFTAAAAGTATIALAFATARRLFGRGGGLPAAFLFMVAPYLVYYSTEARMFALAALLALLGLYLGHRAATDGRWWPAFGAALAVGLWNYYYAAFIAAPVGLLALATLRWRAVAGYLGSIALAGLLFAPWLPTMLGEAASWTNPWTGPTTPGRVLLWTWPALLTGIPAFELWNDQPIRLALLGVAGLAFGLALAGAALRVGSRRLTGLLYAAGAVAVPLIGMAAVALVRPIYHPRYAMPAEPGLLLLVAGVAVVPLRWLLPARLVLVALVLGLSGYGLYRFEYTNGLARDDYRSAIGYVNLHQAPGDVAITNAPPGFDYYYRGDMAHVEFPTAPYEPASIVQRLDAVARGHSRLWYVTHDLRPADPEGFVDGQLGSHARLVDDQRFGQLRVALFQLADPPGFALPRPHPLPGLRFGDTLVLEGFGLDEAPTPAGGRVQLDLTWRVAAPPEADYGVWARLKDDQGFAWGRQDHQPRDARFVLSSQWRVGEVVTTHQSIPVDPGTPPGRYAIEVGVYRLGNLGGLDVRDQAGTKLGPSLVVDDAAVSLGDQTRADPQLKGPTGQVDDAVALVGSGLSQTEVAAGASFETTLLWRAAAAPGPRERVLRLVGPDGKVAAERRDAAGMGRYPADRWRPGDLVREQARFTVPPTLPGGDYQLWAALAPPGVEPRGLTIGTLRVTAIPRQFTLPPIAHRLDADFGDGLRLRGWDATRPDPGHVRVTLVWQPSATPSRDYRVFNHLVDAADKIVAQQDGVPVNWSRPTTGWLAGEAIEDVYDIALPPNVPPLKLRVGLYEPTGGQRLHLANGDDHLDLGAIP